mmetsp:Transcript_57755/g.137475  ORF Transcript_57755/g.137475 Transcript_57755/m.137475 type:complete len:152 (-) Transcript_57755:80-535(-)
MARNRLNRELADIARNPDPDIHLEMTGDTIENWEAVINGPSDSPYAGGKYKLAIECTSAYPVSAPKVKFCTKIFHPNVNFSTGEICLDILKTDWSPAWTLQCLCRAILALMQEPNADSPLNCDAGNLIRNGDVRGFRSMAKMYTAEHAMCA